MRRVALLVTAVVPWGGCDSGATPGWPSSSAVADRAVLTREEADREVRARFGLHGPPPSVFCTPRVARRIVCNLSLNDRCALFAVTRKPDGSLHVSRTEEERCVLP